jgi:hypothetical protein
LNYFEQYLFEALSGQFADRAVVELRRHLHLLLMRGCDQADYGAKSSVIGGV